MVERNAIVRHVRAGLEQDRRINVRRHPIRVTVDDGAVILEGDVDGIAAKKLALEVAARTPSVRGVVDRLRVAVAERRGDGAMRAALCEALLQQPELRRCTIRVDAKGRVDTLRDAGGDRTGELEVSVDDGIVTLDGTVISLSHKRMAGVLAWWTPGCRDVVNSLAVVPAEDDNDAEVVEALRLVLEADPTVDADQITATSRDFVVTLEGFVRADTERARAEFDAWALFAVDGVVNRIVAGKGA